MDQSNGENRFAHLLRPIRDLADNWDIDIAGELVEYLDELDKIVIDFAGGELNMNFAEAALVIQGSATVYTRKVEMLYKLVFDVLDMLCDAPDPRGTAARGDFSGGIKKGGRRKSVAFAVGQEERDAFLLLDDVIQVGNNLNLTGHANVGGRKEENLEDTQGLRERVPFALLGAGSTGPTSSNTTGAFKLLSCDIGGDGAFILDKTRDKHSSFAPTVDSSGNNPFNSGQTLQGSKGENEGDTEAPSDFEDDDGEEMMFFEDQGDENEHGGIQLAGEGSPEHGNKPEGGLPASADAVLNHGYNDDSEEEEEEDGTHGSHDPWARLDPHGHADEKEELVPLKVGKTWKIPKVLQPTKGAKSQSTVFHAGDFSDDLLRNNLLVSVALNPGLAARAPTQENLVLYPELRGFAVERRKRLRAETGTESKPSARRVAARNKDEKAEEAEERLAQFVLNSNARPACTDDDGDLEHNNDDYGYGDEDDNDGYAGGDDVGFCFDDGQSDGEEQQGGPDGSISFGVTLNSQAFDSAPSTYLGMVKAHLQKYLETANQWATESKLHTRVRQWEEKIQPFLQEQNARPAFDIHTYGGRILQGLASQRQQGQDRIEKGDKSAVTAVDNVISFEDLGAQLVSFKPLAKREIDGRQEDLDDIKSEVDDDLSHEEKGAREDAPMDHFEVCRLFLASLQLANNGNVELVHDDNNPELRIKLLDNMLANEKLQHFSAPSVDASDSKPAAFSSDMPGPEAKRPKRGSKLGKKKDHVLRPLPDSENIAA